MAVRPEHDAFIPLSRGTLIELLTSDTGPARVEPLRPESVRELTRLAYGLARCYHAASFDRREAIKQAYLAFDPDREERQFQSVPDDHRPLQTERLIQLLNDLLRRANFRRLSHEEILEAQKIAGDLGVDLSIDLSAFRHLEVFVRGELFVRRQRRPIRSLFRAELFSVEIYPRVVLVYQQQRHQRLPPDADCRNVFLKLFRDIPKMDLEMLIPGAELRMSPAERGKIGASMAVGLGSATWPVMKQLFGFEKSALTIFGLLALSGGLFAYAYRQFTNYLFTVRTFRLRLAQRLYYQNLDNNAGVIYRLIDAAIEQEWRESMLGYYYLWRYAEADGWTAERLDDYIELDLERRLGLSIDFEVNDALAKLKKIGLVTERGNRYIAVPLDRAIELVPPGGDDGLDGR